MRAPMISAPSVDRGDDARPAFTNARYTSPEFLAQEQERVFRTAWFVAARESDLSAPGDCVAFDEMGEALLLVRSHDGVLRTFHNTCRHRGTRLVAEKCSAPRITCPYHGWAYALDGRLIAVPKSDGFDELDRSERGLLPVRTECWGGFVWITLNPAAPRLADYLGAVRDQLSPYRLDEMRPLLRRTWTLPCNWKAVLDQATESYHLRSVHGQSVDRVIDTTSKFSGLGIHHLQTIPIADYWWRPSLDRWSVPKDLTVTPDQLRLFHKYLVFPNMVVNAMPYHLTVFRVFPITADTCRFHYEFHVRARPGVVGRARGWLTLAASLFILREDFRLLRPFQSGVRAAPTQRLAFHEEEAPLAYFHAVLDRHIAGEPQP